MPRRNRNELIREEIVVVLPLCNLIEWLSIVLGYVGTLKCVQLADLVNFFFATP